MVVTFRNMTISKISIIANDRTKFRYFRSIVENDEAKNLRQFFFFFLATHGTCVYKKQKIRVTFIEEERLAVCL